MQDPYQIITERILELLERGTVPWHKPWSTADGPPQNLVSRKPYRGINPFILNCAGYGKPYWLTFRQAKELGGHVRKGEHGYPVVFWKWLELSDKDKPDTIKRVPMLRQYSVFNVSQCDGIPRSAGSQPPRPQSVNSSPLRSASRSWRACPRLQPSAAASPRLTTIRRLTMLECQTRPASTATKRFTRYCTMSSSTPVGTGPGWLALASMRWPRLDHETTARRSWWRRWVRLTCAATLGSATRPWTTRRRMSGTGWLGCAMTASS